MTRTLQTTSTTPAANTAVMGWVWSASEGGLEYAAGRCPSFAGSVRIQGQKSIKPTLRPAQLNDHGRASIR